MKITLERFSNNNYWLYGKICTSNGFKCDSLEMGNENQIESGTYKVTLAQTRDKLNTLISIWDDSFNFISVFVTNNNYIYQNIEIRRDNNFITIGFSNDTCWLNNTHGIYFQLRTIVEKAIENGEKVELIVKNTLKPTKNEEIYV